MKRLLFSTACAAILAGSASLALAASPTTEPAGQPTVDQTLHDQAAQGQKPYSDPQLHKGARGSQADTGQQAENQSSMGQSQMDQSQMNGSQRHASNSRRMRSQQTASLPGDKGAATAALNDLQANGYHSFSNFHRKGSDFEATVRTPNGQTANVLIDPSQGTVSRED